jgi:hypothetical protein
MHRQNKRASGGQWPGSATGRAPTRAASERGGNLLLPLGRILPNGGAGRRGTDVTVIFISRLIAYFPHAQKDRRAAVGEMILWRRLDLSGDDFARLVSLATTPGSRSGTALCLHAGLSMAACDGLRLRTHGPVGMAMRGSTCWSSFLVCGSAGFNCSASRTCARDSVSWPF